MSGKQKYYHKIIPYIFKTNTNGVTININERVKLIN